MNNLCGQSDILFHSIYLSIVQNEKEIMEKDIFNINEIVVENTNLNEIILERKNKY